MIDLLEACQAHAYEYAVELYGLLMAIYQKNRAYKDLARCHKQLERLFSIIAKGVIHPNQHVPIK